MSKTRGLAVLIIMLIIVFLIVRPGEKTEISIEPTPTVSSIVSAHLDRQHTIISLFEICNITNNTYQLKSFTSENSRRPTPIGGPLPSPDGRFQVFSDLEGIRVKDTTNGASLLLIPAHQWLSPAEWARWSPDSRRLAIVDASSDAARATLIYDFGSGLPVAPSIILPTQLDHPENLWGWSPDGRYLVIASHYLYLSVPLTIWQVDQARIRFTSQEKVSAMMWSPRSNALAYLSKQDTGDSTVTGVGLVTADGSDHAFYALHANFKGSYSNDLRFLWSPNEDKVALLHTPDVFYEDTNFYLDVYSFDSTWHVSANVYTYTGWDPIGWKNRTYSPVTWMDNNVLLFWESLSNNDYQMLRWSPETEPVVQRSSTRPPFFPTQSQDEGLYQASSKNEIWLMTGHRIAFYNDQDTLYSIDVMDLDGSNLVQFINDADDAGDPGWSPRGNKVLAIWDADTGSDRRIVLSWMNADGSDRHDFASSRDDIQKVYWSPDEEVIIFAGIDQGRSTYDLEMLDLLTGQHTVLAENVAESIDPRFEYEQAYVALRWRDPTDHQFADGFARDGSRLYRLPISGHMWMAHLFISPDGQVAAIKGMRDSDPRGEVLLIARTDGLSSPVIVREGLLGLGNPLWSPDSRWVAFTSYPAYRQPITIEIYSSDGESIWQAPFNYPTFETATFWTTCPTSED